MLGFYTKYKGGDLYLDASPYMYDLEYTTNEYGFWFLTCKLHINKQLAADLYKQRKVLHVYYGDGRNTFFEGRLEDVEYSNEPKITAYGYIRSFTDLQVTDLWSTKRRDLFSTGPTKLPSANHRPKLFSMQQEPESMDIFLTKNSDPTGIAGVTTPYAYYYLLLPDKYTRPLKMATVVGDAINSSLASFYLGSHGISSSYLVTTANLWTTSIYTSSGVHFNATFSLADSEGAIFYFLSNNAGAYVGETGEFGAKFTDIRIGTTATISGSRLYADEILKYTVSGVYALNPDYINPSTEYVQSPSRDIVECIFEDVTGLDVVQFLLDYPDSNGNPYELKVWEDQKVIFRPAKQTYNTWHVSISDLILVRTLEGTFNQFRGIYTEKLIFRGDRLGWKTYYWNQQVGNITRTVQGNHPVYEQIEMEQKQRTNYYSNQDSIDAYGIKRQTNVALNTTTESASNAKMQTIAGIQSTKVLKSQIAVSYILDSNDARLDPRFVRSGDRIIITNIPGALLEELENTFFITETRWNNKEKLMYLTPEQPIDQLEVVLGSQ